MKVRDLLIKCDVDAYLGINSIDHEEVFCFGTKRSVKLMSYLDRDIINISLKMTKMVNGEDKEVNAPYINILIRHKDCLTVCEAVDKLLKERYGREEINEKLIDIDSYLKTLLEIKNNDYSVDKLFDLRNECLDFMHFSSSTSNFDRLCCISEVLMELDEISFH